MRNTTNSWSWYCVALFVYIIRILILKYCIEEEEKEEEFCQISRSQHTGSALGVKHPLFFIVSNIAFNTSQFLSEFAVVLGFIHTHRSKGDRIILIVFSLIILINYFFFLFFLFYFFFFLCVEKIKRKLMFSSIFFLPKCPLFNGAKLFEFFFKKIKICFHRHN